MNVFTRTIVLAVAALALGCSSTFERVARTKALLEAREALRGEAPSTINTYPPTAEAWYFGWQHCVLFIDGVQRWTKTMTETRVPLHERGSVDCSLDAYLRERTSTD